MNTLFIVLPILTLLMFDLGLTLRWSDFLLMAERPRAVCAGMAGQLILLPLIAFGLGWLFGLEPVFFVGLILIACSPGGSSSNVFSMLAGGNVALSVTLTALSSVLTFITIPPILQAACHLTGSGSEAIHLPVGQLIVQNLVLTLLPVLIGVGIKAGKPQWADRMHRVLKRIAFPALMLLATVFFIQHRVTIVERFGQLGLCVTLLIALAMAGGSLLAHAVRLDSRDRRTLVIEVGMQNAAQAIAIACSPFVFHNSVMAVPAIVYALMMNLVLLGYVGLWQQRLKRASVADL